MRCRTHFNEDIPKKKYIPPCNDDDNYNASHPNEKEYKEGINSYNHIKIEQDNNNNNDDDYDSIPAPILISTITSDMPAITTIPLNSVFDNDNNSNNPTNDSDITPRINASNIHNDNSDNIPSSPSPTTIIEGKDSDLTKHNQDKLLITRLQQTEQQLRTEIAENEEIMLGASNMISQLQSTIQTLQISLNTKTTNINQQEIHIDEAVQLIDELQLSLQMKTQELQQTQNEKDHLFMKLQEIELQLEEGSQMKSNVSVTNSIHSEKSIAATTAANIQNNDTDTDNHHLNKLVIDKPEQQQQQIIGLNSTTITNNSHSHKNPATTAAVTVGTTATAPLTVTGTRAGPQPISQYRVKDPPVHVIIDEDETGKLRIMISKNNKKLMSHQYTT